MTDQTRPAIAGALPLFYRAPTLLRFDDHRRFGLRQTPDYAFAATATAIPVVAGEFNLAGRHYPIVFASDESATPLVVTGVASDRNLLVGLDGQWMPGRYIPSYVRRYPFISMTAEGAPAPMLGIDAASGRISTDADADGADRLFDADGKATAAAEAAMALCAAYAGENDRTVAFVEALKRYGLLVERSAQMSYADASRALVQGFRLVDEQAFRTLPSEVVVEFHGKGWLDLIILHLASQASWQDLVDHSAPKPAND